MNIQNEKKGYALVVLTVVLALSAGVGLGMAESTDSTAAQDTTHDGESAPAAIQDENETDGNVTKLTIRSRSGFIAFDEDSLESAQSNGLSFPDAFINQSREILIEGAINDDGTWEVRTFRFPDLQTSSGISADVTTTDATGEIDREEGLLSIQSGVNVTVGGDAANSFTYDVGPTTEESGALSGELSLDNTTGNATGTVTLVDNEYTVPTTTGNGLVDQTLGLPIEEPGRAWLQIEGEIEIVSGASEEDFSKGGDQDDTVETPESGSLFTTIGMGLGAITLLASAGLVIFGLARRAMGAGDRDEQLKVE